ncbi:MAG: undecaprenyl/decaprenyl-phosphate alpha-N-acetylglucosaminyl 1-phosphate transferase [Treponema sp.]|jgi:UDP-GlcNAc:undecaprenyl-phosphate GlcNAc-1-phosphate transferase|nr:undecaprenyl/decaprenyl-phosphate alpha-N-acetylglucosaminyl 1-phosphate transferase [Treponema sp.]
MIGIVVVAGVSFLLSAFLVGVVLRLSHLHSWYDMQDERKIHIGDVPRLGGLGFSLAFIFVATVISFNATENYYGYWFLPVILGMFLILIFGIFDDFKPLAPRIKLLVQIVAALLVVIPDYTFHSLFFTGADFLKNFNWLRYPLTVLWLVGLSNALNLIDGVDGLAGGISLLAALAYALIFTSFADSGSAVLFCVCLAANIGGFLVFNLPLPRAKIFMGDGGSQFLGFMLAVLPLLNKGSAEPELPLFYAAALLMIPILDTTAAVWRRIRDRRRIDSPDRAHIHHKLINLGLNARGVDAVLYGLQIVLCILVFISIRIRGLLSIAVLGIAYIIGVGFFCAVHFLNQRVTKQRRTETPPAE